MLVIGADVCKDRIVCFGLSQIPLDPQLTYQSGEWWEFDISTKGLKDLLNLQPDVLVLEPTGVNYSKFWVTKAAESGIEIALVGHKQLGRYRESLGLPDKDDFADALALGCYYLQYQKSYLRFVRVRDDVTSEMRDRVLRLHHLARLQSPLVNRAKQDLAWAFPEKHRATLSAPLFWKWLAGRARSAKYDRLYESTCGLGIPDDLRFAAGMLVEVLQRERVVELELRSFLNHPQFLPYREVLSRYGMGERVQALIISQIYPLSNYLGDDGQPIVIHTKGKKSGKPTKKPLSLRRFRKALGVVPTREQSGMSATKTTAAGSQLCRTALWQWCFTRIEVDKMRSHTPLGLELIKDWEYFKSVNPIKLARAKFIAKTVNRIFYDLLAATK
jgi:transposase